MSLGLYGGAIPNPKRTVTVDFGIEKVRQALILCQKYITDIEQCKADDILHIYTLHFSESLSFGSNMIVQLEAIAPEKTVINFEMQRAIGSYDSDAKVSYANRQLNLVCEKLSKVLSMEDDEVEKLRIGEVQVLDSEKKTLKTSMGCLIGLIIIVALVIWLLV